MNRAEKIHALLTQAAGTDNPKEAETYQAAAEELMLKWGIDDAMLKAAGQALNDQIEHRMFRLDVDEQNAGDVVGKLQIVSQICAGLGNLRCYFVKMPYGTDYLPLYVVGYSSDVDRFALLWDFLLPQLEAALESWWHAYLDHLSPMQYVNARTKVHRRAQFLASYGASVGDRLRSERQSLVHTTSGAELAVISRLSQVDANIAENFPDTQNEEFAVEYSITAQMAGWTGGAQANLLARTQVDA